jgi:cation/acetate symporter
LTTAGAIAGLVVGGTSASIAVLVTIGGGTGGLTGALLAQPAAWSVPTAFAVMVLVSLATASSVPPGAARTMVRLHTPEGLALDRGPGRQDG